MGESGTAVLRDRIKAAAARVDECDEGLAIARERRDGLIVEAIDSGHSTRDVARWAGLAQSRIHAILAKPPAPTSSTPEAS